MKYKQENTNKKVNGLDKRAEVATAVAATQWNNRQLQVTRGTTTNETWTQKYHKNWVHV